MPSANSGGSLPRNPSPPLIPASSRRAHGEAPVPDALPGTARRSTDVLLLDEPSGSTTPAAGTWSSSTTSCASFATCSIDEPGATCGSGPALGRDGSRRPRGDDGARCNAHSDGVLLAPTRLAARGRSAAPPDDERQAPGSAREVMRGRGSRVAGTRSAPDHRARWDQGETSVLLQVGCACSGLAQCSLAGRTEDRDGREAAGGGGPPSRWRLARDRLAGIRQFSRGAAESMPPAWTRSSSHSAQQRAVPSGRAQTTAIPSESGAVPVMAARRSARARRTRRAARRLGRKPAPGWPRGRTTGRTTRRETAGHAFDLRSARRARRVKPRRAAVRPAGRRFGARAVLRRYGIERRRSSLRRAPSARTRRSLSERQRDEVPPGWSGSSMTAMRSR
jgi:hypothetical protein